MHLCSKCKQAFQTEEEFDDHSCVQEAMKKPRDQLLKELFASGGCTKKYYDEQMAILKGGK